MSGVSDITYNDIFLVQNTFFQSENDIISCTIWQFYNTTDVIHFDVLLDICHQEILIKFSFQVFHYREIIFHYKGQILDFNLGMISSVMSSNDSTILSSIYIHVFMDISKYSNKEPFGVHNPNTGRTRRSTRNTLQRMGISLTYFNVPIPTSCYVSIASQYGTLSIHFKNGAIISWTENSWIKNVTTTNGRAFVTYGRSSLYVNFDCTCIDQNHNCSGKK